MTKKEVVTKSVLVPLPKSCESLVGSFDQLVNSANRIHNRTREVYRRADAVDGESLVSSEAGYRFEQWLLRSNSAASDDLHAMMEYADNAESGLALCKSDMAKAAADAD